MEYENIDEATKRLACEKVKKIAEAIKKIRKKYYLCFNRISDVDKIRYDGLKAQMQSIASENGLDKLNAELLNDIEIQYNENLPDNLDSNGMQNKNLMEELNQQFRTAVQIQAELTVLYDKTEDSELGNAYLVKARKVQNRIREISKILEKSYNIKNLDYEKGSILGKIFKEQSKEYFFDLLRNIYKSIDDPLTQSDILGIFYEETLSKDIEPIER